MQTVNSNLFVGGPKDGQTIPMQDHLNTIEFPDSSVYKRMAFRVGDAEISYWQWTEMAITRIKISMETERCG